MEIPAGLGLKDMAILGRRGSHSLLQRGALSVLLRGGCLVWMAACSCYQLRTFIHMHAIGDYCTVTCSNDYGFHCTRYMLPST